VQAATFTPFDSFPFPVDITDIGDAIIYVNAAFERTYGYEAARVIGLPPHFLLPPDFNRTVLRQNLAELHGGKVWEGVQPNLTASGEVIEVYVLGVPLGARGSEQAFGTIYVSSEVGQRDRMQSEFLELMARHYFSTEILPDFRSRGAVRRGERSRMVIGLLQLGYSPKRIAAMLGISASTVGVIKWKAKQRGKKTLAVR
jgi:PAS domain S-box-containing protein